MLSSDAGGSSLTAVLVLYTVRLFLLKAGEYLGKLLVALLFQGGDGITADGATLLLVVVVVVLVTDEVLKTHGPVLHLLAGL